MDKENPLDKLQKLEQELLDNDDLWDKMDKIYNKEHYGDHVYYNIEQIFKAIGGKYNNNNGKVTAEVVYNDYLTISLAYQRIF